MNKEATSYQLRQWDGETLIGGFARALTMCPVGTRAPRRWIPDRAARRPRMTRVCDDRAVRVDEPVAVPNEALAAKVGEWTLVDPGPFRVDGKKQQHLMAECKCEGRRYFTRAAWVRGRNEKACGKQEMSQCCDNCFAARRKTNISVRSEPAAILPHYKMKGG